MVEFDCPWCDEPATLPFPLAQESEDPFRCTACGTTIAWADETVALDQAA